MALRHHLKKPLSPSGREEPKLQAGTGRDDKVLELQKRINIQSRLSLTSKLTLW